MGLTVVFVRTLLVYVMLLGLMRLMGKRQLGEMELPELVVAVLISDLASLPLQDIGIPMLNGVIPAVTLLCLELLISAAGAKSIRLRSFLFGKPSIVIENGRIVQKEMTKNRLTLDELTEELRRHSICDIGAIKYAILETDGTLSTLLYRSEEPLTASALGLRLKEDGLPVEVISDGRVIDESLSRLGLDRRWLDAKLRERGCVSPKEVYYMTVDGGGELYFQAKEKK